MKDKIMILWASRAIMLTLLLGIYVKSMAQEASNFVPISDGKLYFRTFGEGPPMLIINGGPGFNSNGFESLAERIANLGYTSILFDQRGTGLSTLHTIDSHTITLDKMVEDCEKLRKYLGYDQWRIYGHSFGGILANAYVSKHPDKVEKLILSNSGGLTLDILTAMPKALKEILGENKVKQLTKYADSFQITNDSSFIEQYRLVLASAYMVDQSYTPLIASRLGEINQKINQLVWQDLQRKSYDIRKVVGKYSGEVLILKGEQDVVPLFIAEQEKESYKNANLVIFPACGHYPWLDRPVLFEETMKNL